MSGSSCDAVQGCITCGDAGIPMRVLESDEKGAVCADDHGERHEVALDLVGEVGAGSRVLVHAGVAIGEL